MSRGYAEEARKVIEEESYNKFDQKFSTDNSTNMADIENDKFVSSKFYKLYTITLFNQALAEKRSYLYSEAERNFKRIIKYAERDTLLHNFNYYSTLLNLSDLYMDQGRGKEAIEFLKKVKKLDEDDIRYWNADLAEITDLIDQSEYDNAEGLLLDKFIKEENGFTLSERHKVTSPGFKALNHFARCQIEKVRNTLKICEGDKESVLKKAEKILKDNIPTLIKRNQKGLEIKAYKHLSEIYEILDDQKNAIKYLTKYLSNGKIDNLNKFVCHKKMEDWINVCDDLDVLESFAEIICELLRHNGRHYKIISLHKCLEKIRECLKKIRDVIKRECDDKGQLSRAERNARKINEVLVKERVIKYKGCFYTLSRDFNVLIWEFNNARWKNKENKKVEQEKELD